MTERVIVSVDGGVAHVRMNRPDKRNGLDLPMCEGLVAAGERLMADATVRAVVLSGEGRAFCAGLDVAAFFSMGAEAGQRLLDRAGGVANVAQRCAWIWQEVPVPVIAAVHGACFGGGLQIALGADIRIAAPDARLSVMEVRWGLIPDMAITQSLPRLVNIDVAKELTFTGRRVSGAEALALGLVTRLAGDPLAAARQLAAEIASKSPDAIRAGKRLLDESWTAPAADALLLETELQKALIGSPNQLAAMTAGVTKEPAVFQDPS